MGILDDLEGKGKELLGDVVSDAQSGGVEGLQKLATTQGMEGELDKVLTGKQSGSSDSTVPATRTNRTTRTIPRQFGQF